MYLGALELQLQLGRGVHHAVIHFVIIQIVGCIPDVIIQFVRCSSDAVPMSLSSLYVAGPMSLSLSSLYVAGPMSLSSSYVLKFG